MNVISTPLLCIGEW